LPRLIGGKAEISYRAAQSALVYSVGASLKVILAYIFR
jgi:hypothetical protein